MFTVGVHRSSIWVFGFLYCRQSTIGLLPTPAMYTIIYLQQHTLCYLTNENLEAQVKYIKAVSGIFTPYSHIVK
ncbi:hypothetical protein P3S67_031334 [Capsicum chacoense]